MRLISRRHDRMKIVAKCLLAGMIFLFLAPATACTQQSESPGDDAAGSVWRSVRAGGGLTSPLGRTGMGLRAVASNGKRFVAVGEQGTIAHSTDGNRWVEAGFTATESRLSDVAWGGGRFVAVGDYQIVYSSDGDRWRRSHSGDTGDLESLAWGNDRFVAVGDNGSIAHSIDGIRWRRVRHDATRADLQGVTWGAGRFVAVGSDGTIVYSADGLGWQTAGQTGRSVRLGGVAWNGERFVTVGWDFVGHAVTILHSSDGERWEPATYDSVRPGPLRDIVWSGHRFVAVGSNTILHSGDGRHWLPAAEHAAGNLNAVAWNGAVFAAVSWHGHILRSADGVQWEIASEAGAGVPLPDLVSVAWGGDRFVAVGHFPDGILHSADGQEWQVAVHLGYLSGLSDVIWDGNRFLAVGFGSVGYSRDGDRWQRAHVAGDAYLHAVAWNGDRYVAVGLDGLIMYSRDGEFWSRAGDSATTETLNGVAWNGERFVAVGRHGVIVHSSDGDRWQPARRPAVPLRVAQPDDPSNVIYYSFEDIAWNDERFVAVGFDYRDHGGTVVHSVDGDRWELAADHDYLAGEHFSAVAWNGERFVAVSDRDGAIMHSADGDRWEPARETATLDRLYGVAWGSGRFVAVGDNGTIVTSP